MKLTELFEQVRSPNPGRFDTINERKAVSLLRPALAELSKLIENAEDGVAEVKGLGNFRISQVEREVEGVKASMRRIMFRTAAAKGINKGKDIPAEPGED